MGVVDCTDQEFRIVNPIAFVDDVIYGNRVHMVNDYLAMDVIALNT
jgi:hypothetical protein